MPPLKHIMVDLETLDTVATAAILSIGAVEFDPTSDKIGETFYITINTESCVEAGLSINPKTVEWWMGQAPEARKVLVEAKNSNVSLKSGMQQFTEWFNRRKAVYLWGNGAAFDNAIMSHAYRAVGLEQPWKFWNDRCYRTLKALAPEDIVFERIGTYHNALDDAISQAKHMQRFMGGAE